MNTNNRTALVDEIKRLADGWWNTAWDCWQSVFGDEMPDCTHWMPLPPPPKDEA